MSGDYTSVKLTEAVAQSTGRRHCRSCGMDKPADGGKWRVARDGIRRWRCQQCTERKNPSWGDAR